MEAELVKFSDLLSFLTMAFTVRATKMIRGLKHPLLGGKADRVGAVQPGEEKAAGRGRPYGSLSYPKGAYRKDRENIFNRGCCDRTRRNGFKLREGRFRLDIRKKFFYDKGVETLELIARRSSGGPTPGNIQGQFGQRSEQPGLVEDVPTHCRGVRLDDL